MRKITEFFAKIAAKFKKLDIYGNLKIFLLIPLAIILIMLICGTAYELTNTKFDHFANIGVDFQGGTLLTAEFSETGMNSGTKYDENLALIKGVLNDNGFEAASVQSSGESSIIVRYLNTARVDGQLVDYSSDEKVSEMNLMNEKIAQEISAKVSAHYNGQVTVKSTTTMIGNSASINLLRTALLATGIALLVMLIYIVIRFDFYSGLAAVVVQLHDAIIMLAFTVIFYVEINSTIVAAVVTVVAYSINNTIVIFDRVRSSIKPYKDSKEKYVFKDIVNQSIFATMKRNIYATFTTLIMVMLLAIIGVASIQAFALPIIFGLLAGFYSSAFLAAPLWGMFKDWGDILKKKNANRKFKKQRSPARA